jgi:MFS family permease
MSITSIRRRYAFLYGLRWFAIGFIVPVLVLLADARGLNVTQIGLAFLPFGLMTALLELPTGGLADSRGRRPVLVAAALLQVGGLVAWGLSRSTLAFALSGAVMGAARALDSGPLEAWFVDATHDAGGTDDESVRRGLALGSVAECVALALGSLLGGLLPRLLDGLPDGRSAIVIPLSVPFLVAAALSALHAVALVALLSATPHRSRDLEQSGPSLMDAVREGMRIATRVRTARRLLYGFAAFGLALTTVEVLWPQHVIELFDEGGAGASVRLGALFAGAFAASAVGAMLTTRAVRLLRGDPTLTLRVGQLTSAAALVVMALTSSRVLSVVAFLALYGAWGVFGPLHRELLHECVGRDARSVLLSAASLVTQGGSVVAKLTVFPLAARSGIPAAWWAAAGAMALTAVLYEEVRRRASDSVESPLPLPMTSIAGSDPLP